MSESVAGMRYEIYLPPMHLSDYVEHFWMVEAPAHVAPHREILIPNGRPTILVCMAEPGLRLPMDGAPAVKNVSNISGTLTRPIVLEQSGLSRYLGAQLKPWGLKAFGLPPLIDETLALSTWLDDGAGALEMQCNAQGFGEQAVLPLIAILDQHLTALPSDRLALLVKAFESIVGDDVMDVDTLRHRIGLGYDALYRLFRTYCGVTPKRFLAIVRFYGFTGALLDGQFGSKALLANMQGYYDQAHASREFKRFTGLSQSEFEITLNGIAKLMHGTP